MSANIPVGFETKFSIIFLITVKSPAIQAHLQIIANSILSLLSSDDSDFIPSIQVWTTNSNSLKY